MLASRLENKLPSPGSTYEQEFPPEAIAVALGAYFQAIWKGFPPQLPMNLQQQVGAKKGATWFAHMDTRRKVVVLNRRDGGLENGASTEFLIPFARFESISL